MSDEILKAAERLRRHWDAEDSCRADEITLAKAWLMEHDQKPIEKKWLQSLGAKVEDHPDKVTFDRQDALPVGLWSVDDGWKAMLIHHPNAATQIVRGLKTRGDVRRLLLALGAIRP